MSVMHKTVLRTLSVSNIHIASFLNLKESDLISFVPYAFIQAPIVVGYLPIPVLLNTVSTSSRIEVHPVTLYQCCIGIFIIKVVRMSWFARSTEYCIAPDSIWFPANFEYYPLIIDTSCILNANDL